MLIGLLKKYDILIGICLTCFVEYNRVRIVKTKKAKQLWFIDNFCTIY